MITEEIPFPFLSKWLSTYQQLYYGVQEFFNDNDKIAV